LPVDLHFANHLDENRMIGKLDPESSLNKAVIGLLVGLLMAPLPVFGDDISNGSYSTTDGGNNSAPPNGWPAGMAPNAVEPTARASMGATARWWERANPKLSTTGSAGSYVLTPSNTSYPTAYTQGEVYCAKANFASQGGDTLNVNSLGARGLYKPGPSAPIAIGVGDVANGQQFCASYDAALNSGAGGFQILNSISAGSQSLNKTISVVTSGGSNFVSISVPTNASGGCSVKIAATVVGLEGYAGSYFDQVVSFGNYAGTVSFNVGSAISSSFTLNSGNLAVGSFLQAAAVTSSIQLIFIPNLSGASVGGVTGMKVTYSINCYGVGSIIPTPLI
jgi:hypothetical protein